MHSVYGCWLIGGWSREQGWWQCPAQLVLYPPETPLAAIAPTLQAWAGVRYRGLLHSDTEMPNGEERQVRRGG